MDTLLEELKPEDRDFIKFVRSNLRDMCEIARTHLTDEEIQTALFDGLGKERYEQLRRNL